MYRPRSCEPALPPPLLEVIRISSEPEHRVHYSPDLDSFMN